MKPPKLINDPLPSEYTDLVELLSSNPNLCGSAKDFCKAAEKRGVFWQELQNRTGTGRYRKMAEILKRHLGKELWLNNGERVHLHPTWKSNSHTFYFKSKPL